MSTTPFEKGARVALVGDSITHASMYPSYLQQYYYVHLRHLGVKFYNFGCGSGTAEGAIERLDYILRAEPTDVCLMFGVNDIVPSLYVADATAEQRRERADRCRRHLEATERLCRFFTGRGIAVTLCSSLGRDELFPVTETYPLTSFGTTEVLSELFRENSVALAGMLRGTVDYLTPFQALTRELLALGGPSLFRDRVHPALPGQQLMARIFLAESGLPVAMPTAAHLMLGWHGEPLLPELSRRYDAEMQFRNLRWIYPHQAEKTPGLSLEERVAFYRNAAAGISEPNSWTANVYRFYAENAHRDGEIEKCYFDLTDALYQ